MEFSCEPLTRLNREGCFSSCPQRWIKFHPRLRGLGRAWSAVWRAAGCPVWRPGPRTLWSLHCLRVGHGPGSWQKAIEDQPRADHIPEQMLAPSQEYRTASRRGKTSPPQTAEKTVAFSTLPASLLGQTWPIQFPGTSRLWGT